MGGACNTYGGWEAYTGFWLGNLRERDHLEDNIKMDFSGRGMWGQGLDRGGSV
jgi:hypothetical protein